VATAAGTGKPVVTPAPASAQVTDVGYDIVEYGASVETKDETCLTLRLETQEIEAANQETEQCVERESRTEAQLQKDLGHAKNELRSLNQGASDQLDSAKMFSTLAQNLTDEFESGIIRSAMSADSTLSTEQQTGSGIASSSHSITLEARTDDKSNKCKLLSKKEILERKDSRANSILRNLEDKENELKSIFAENRNLYEKRLRLQQSMESQGLEESLQRAREEEKRLEAEVKQDEDTQKTRTVEIQQTRELCGTKGQECTELTKQLSEAKRANGNEQNKLRQQLEAETTKLQRLRKEKEEKMLEVDEKKSKNQKLSKHIEDWEYYTKSMKEYRAAKEVRSEKMKKLQERQNQLKLKLQEQEKLEKASLLQKKKAEEEANRVRVIQKENSDREAALLAAGKEELTKLAEEKMQLASQISETSKISEQEQAKEHEALAAKEEALKDANQQVELLEGKLRTQQEETKATSEKHEEFKRLHQEQIASHESLTRKFSGMYEAEKKIYEAKYKERHNQLSGEFVRKVQDLKSSVEQTKFKMEVFEQGSRMLEAVKIFEHENAKAD